MKIYNKALFGEDTLSISPFYTPQEVNVKKGAITTIEFLLDATGEYTISYQSSEVTGILVVED